MKSYKQLKLNDEMVREHVVLWEATYGPTPTGFVVDHINGDIFDNRLENLRLATRSQNAMNAKRPTDNKTGLKGLSWDAERDRWRGSVRSEGSQHLFRSKDLFETCCWIISTRKALHGEFARIN
jgi:hypothetical protein